MTREDRKKLWESVAAHREAQESERLSTLADIERVVDEIVSNALRERAGSEIREDSMDGWR